MINPLLDQHLLTVLLFEPLLIKVSRAEVTECWAEAWDSDMSCTGPQRCQLQRKPQYSPRQLDENNTDTVWRGTTSTHVLSPLSALTEHYLRARSRDRPVKSKKLRYSDATSWLKSLLQTQTDNGFTLVTFMDHVFVVKRSRLWDENLR